LGLEDDVAMAMGTPALRFLQRAGRCYGAQ